MTKVMCFGTFDLFHLGHLKYFQQAKSYGNHLTVVISRDKNVKKNLVFNEQERLELIKQLKIVDEVILGNESDYLQVIEEKNPSVVCLGYDQPIQEEDLKQELANRGLNPEIKRMKSYNHEKHKSSLIKESILNLP